MTESCTVIANMCFLEVVIIVTASSCRVKEKTGN